jgi:hypothetical protein
MKYKLGTAHEFTAGADIGMSQYVYTEWSSDESELLAFPTAQAKNANGIALSKASKGSTVTVMLKRTPPAKPSEIDTHPNPAV